MTPDRATQLYIALRDKVALLKEQQSKQLKPFIEAMAGLEVFMLDALNKSGLDSMKGEHGTFFKKNHTSASVKEWKKTLDFIIDGGEWQLLEARVNKTEVTEMLKRFAEEVKAGTRPAEFAAIPGVEIRTETVVNVRRPTDKA